MWYFKNYYIIRLKRRILVKIVFDAHHVAGTLTGIYTWSVRGHVVQWLGPRLSKPDYPAYSEFMNLGNQLQFTELLFSLCKQDKECLF